MTLLQSLKTNEASAVEASEFPELSVKNLWGTWKENPTIKESMPDYKDSELPERSFSLGIVGTLYKEGLEGVIETAYKHLNKHYENDTEKLIELTAEMKEMIDQVVSYNNKITIILTNF